MYPFDTPPPENPTLEMLLDTIHERRPQTDLTMVKLAYEFADEAHQGQIRKSGVPYIIHPLCTAITLAKMNMDPTIVVAGLLHDVPEDTSVTIEEIEKNFGAEVAHLVAGVTKLGKIKYRGIERYIENLRKMFVAMAEDIRVVIIKFADRLHNLHTLEHLQPKKQYRIALETLEIYAPIANRLGMGEMKGQLEDLSFKYVFPKEYAWVRGLVEERYEKKEAYINEIRLRLEQELNASGIKFISVEGRLKRLYSLYQKLLKHDKNIEKISDLLALRIIVNDVADCYATLGIIHKLWRPLPGRIKDYIAQPKPNGYQSLHTSVFCEKGQVVEFQIRDEQQHINAEYGIAAHWSYDEADPDTNKSRQLRWVRELAAVGDAMERLKDLENLKIDIFQNRIFVFTPKGDVIDLPENATPVDFAFAVHTQIGNQCAGARVNDRIVSLDQPLKSGDVIDIVVDKTKRGPSADWIKFVKTNHAKGCIKQYAKRSLSDWIKAALPSRGK
ncbi:MAG: RelA/SpoT family protein [Candidatus Magasanikbacteria bacterium]|nr:RelA/SpoT family protein [Candidatus Magasanikbacteria bacterium]